MFKLYLTSILVAEVVAMAALEVCRRAGSCCTSSP